MVVIAIRSKRYTKITQISKGTLIEDFGGDIVVWGNPETHEVFDNSFVNFVSKKHRASFNTEMHGEESFKCNDTLVGLPYYTEIKEFTQVGSETHIEIHNFGKVHVLSDLDLVQGDGDIQQELNLEFYQDVKIVDGKWTPAWTLDKLDELTEIFDTDTESIINEKHRIHSQWEVYQNIRKTIDGQAEGNNESGKLFTLNRSKDLEEKDLGENNGDPECPFCNGKGRYMTRFGIYTTCNCVTDYLMKKKLEEQRKEKFSKPLKLTATIGEQNMAVQNNLIPESRKDDKFSIGELNRRVKDIAEDTKIKLDKTSYDKYYTTLTNINIAIGSGDGLKHSYLISAPNGFCKTTFANSCIANLSGNGKPMVPYKSLTELARLLTTNAMNFKYIRERKYDSVVNKRDGEYDWNDYLNAEVVFCYLTVPEVVNVELPTLKSLLDIRGANGLATIVFAERPVNVYRVSQDIELFMLSDMITTQDRFARMDRLLVIEVKKSTRYNYEYGK